MRNTIAINERRQTATITAAASGNCADVTGAHRRLAKTAAANRVNVAPKIQQPPLPVVEYLAQNLAEHRQKKEQTSPRHHQRHRPGHPRHEREQQQPKRHRDQEAVAEDADGDVVVFAEIFCRVAKHSLLEKQHQRRERCRQADEQTDRQQLAARVVQHADPARQIKRQPAPSMIVAGQHRAGECQ